LYAADSTRAAYGGPLREAANIAKTKVEREMLAELATASERRRLTADRHLVTLDRWSEGWTGTRENRPARIASLIREAITTGVWN
jgi:hypothetical protein